MATVSAPKKRASRPRLEVVEPGPISIMTNKLALTIPAAAFNLDGFRKWATAPDFPEDVKVAYLEGEVFLDMSNEEQETHNKVKGEVYWVVKKLNRELDLGEVYCDGILITHETAEVSNNPDTLLVKWETSEAGRVTRVPREDASGQYIEMVGAPDWVLEVVSDSSVRKDLVQLRKGYHLAAIPEYWLVDARGDDIDFQLLIWTKNGYEAAGIKRGWQWSPVFQRSFKFTRKRNRGGRWDYDLLVRKAR